MGQANDVGRGKVRREGDGGGGDGQAVAELPYWIVGNGLWERLPDGVRRAAKEVIQPAYRHMVLEARTELERSAGITLIHLLWLEISDQLAMADAVADRRAIVAKLSEHEEMIQRHLHLVHAKQRATEMVLKLQTFARLFAAQPAAVSPIELDGIAEQA